MPAARQRSRSPGMALAVRATTASPCRPLAWGLRAEARADARGRLELLRAAQRAGEPLRAGADRLPDAGPGRPRARARDPLRRGAPPRPRFRASWGLLSPVEKRRVAVGLFSRATRAP